MSARLQENLKMNAFATFRVNQLALVVAAITHASTAYAEHTVLEPLVVEGVNQQQAPYTASTIDRRDIRSRFPSADSASLLSDLPGISINQTGGISSLPSIRGMADDRLRIKLDGMDLISTCPNHMNPPMSYISPSNIEQIDVFAGITPVSVGGDSIGGSIVIESTNPSFANPGETISKGEIGGYYRSNNRATGVNLNAEYANEDVNVNYSGSWSQADNYRAGDGFKTFTASGRPGISIDVDEVASTAYQTQDHTLGLAYLTGVGLFEMKLGYQHMPEQLYPNQRMDLLDNEQKRANLAWTRKYDWGKLQARAYYEAVYHFMNFGPDKRLQYGTAFGMPMFSDSYTYGYNLKAEYSLTDSDVLKIGGEYITYDLEDYWPASGTGVMSPNTFLNINDGERDRLAFFAEWESQINEHWLTSLGLRYEHVMSDAGDVQGYSDNNATGPVTHNMQRDSDAFNASDRDISDDNIDLTALAQYHHNDSLEIAMGLARKVRSPNLYERYTWSTFAMATVMNNLYGDGNGYIGNVNLDPEKAYTASVTFDVHAANRDWEIQATPYYTHVEDYIDAAKGAVFVANQFNILNFVNQSARITGVDLAGRMNLGSNAYGYWDLLAKLSYTDGENRDTGDNLYNIMPLNGKLTLKQQHKGWNNSLEWVMVSQKDDVNEVRNEIETAGYSLFNLRLSHGWQEVQVDMGIENILDHFYNLPTGGTYTGQGSTMQINGIPWGIAVPGMGRSFYAGLKFSF